MSRGNMTSLDAQGWKQWRHLEVEATSPETRPSALSSHPLVAQLQRRRKHNLSGLTRLCAHDLSTAK